MHQRLEVSQLPGRRTIEVTFDIRKTALEGSEISDLAVIGKCQGFGRRGLGR